MGAPEDPIRPTDALEFRPSPSLHKREVLDEFGDETLAEEKGDVMRFARANTGEDIQRVRRFKATLPVKVRVYAHDSVSNV